MRSDQKMNQSQLIADLERARDHGYNPSENPKGLPFTEGLRFKFRETLFMPKTIC